MYKIKAANQIFVEHKFQIKQINLLEKEVSILNAQNENLSSQVANHKQINLLQKDLNSAIKSQNRILKISTIGLAAIAILTSIAAAR